MGKQQSLKFRTDVAMMGKMGYDIRVNNFTADELSFSNEAVKTYKRISDVIWQGDLYRLSDPKKESVAALMYVNAARTSAVVFNYLVNNRYGQGSVLPVVFKGLDPSKTYTITETNIYPGTSSPINAGVSYSGDFLMTVGFNPQVSAGRNSVVLQVEEKK